MTRLIRCTFAFVVTAIVGAQATAIAAEIRWAAVGLDRGIIPDATIEVITGGVVIATGESVPGAQQNVLQFPASSLRGNTVVTIRIKAIGREEVSMVNMLGDTNQVISVVLPQVYRAPDAQPCKPAVSPCSRWCRKHRWRRK